MTALQNRESVLKEYTTRLEKRRQSATKLLRRNSWISNARLLAFLLIVLTGLLGLFVESIALPWTVVPLLLFIGLVIYHGRIIEEENRANGRSLFMKQEFID